MVMDAVLAVNPKSVEMADKMMENNAMMVTLSVEMDAQRNAKPNNVAMEGFKLEKTVMTTD